MAQGDETAESPWLSARRTWNGHLAAEASSRRMWQIVAVGALLIALAAVGGVVAIGSQSKIVPYVVALKPSGEVAGGGFAVPASGETAVIHSTMAQFIEDARMVSVDSGLQRKAILWLYAHIAKGDPATQKMNTWLSASDTNPFARAQKELVSVQINSVLQLSQASWQVDWTETTTDTNGQLVSQPSKWRAVLTVFVSPTKNQNEAAVEANPLGVFVRDYSWARLQ